METATIVEARHRYWVMRWPLQTGLTLLGSLAVLALASGCSSKHSFPEKPAASGGENAGGAAGAGETAGEGGASTSGGNGGAAGCGSLTDPQNCGVCGFDCTALTNVKPSAAGVACRDGICFVPPSACVSGFGHCSSEPNDGCEAKLTDPQNCGICAVQCTGANPLCTDTSDGPMCTNACSPNPCLNQGTCTSVGGVAKCQCAGGFRGATCIAPIYTQLTAVSSTTFCRASGVSGNGTVVVGHCATSTVGDSIPVKWNTAGTPTTLPSPLPGADALGVNLTGKAIVGWTNVDPSLGGQLAALWPATIQPTLLSGLTSGSSSSMGRRVSSNGLVVIGSSDNRAVYWNTTDVIVEPTIIDPGTFIFNDSYGVSADGSVIVGQSSFGQNVAAFRWKSGVWGTLPNISASSTSFARGVSDDGLVTVGFSGGQAVRWVETAAPVPLGTAGNADAASANGNIIVGVTGSTALGSTVAFLWDATSGAQTLNEVLTGLGVDLSATNLAEATDVSDDGTVIVGWGTSGSNEIAWMVNLAGTGVSGL